jgi:hypothetical protein
MRFFVDNTEYPLSKAKVRALNFGQHWRSANIREFNYKLLLDNEVYVDFLINHWTDFLDDALSFRDSEFDIDVLIRKFNYPEADKILSDINFYIDIVNELFEISGHDILLSYLGDSISNENHWVINTIDNIEFENEYFILTGRCRNNENVTAFQDY